MLRSRQYSESSCIRNSGLHCINVRGNCIQGVRGKPEMNKSIFEISHSPLRYLAPRGEHSAMRVLLYRDSAQQPRYGQITAREIHKEIYFYVLLLRPGSPFALEHGPLRREENSTIHSPITSLVCHRFARVSIRGSNPIESLSH